ncbi:hypothetical protein LIER_07403 [Lithospermum erythrorhizon]|uniref:Uncharacterized protein n=1 Tax=Lithospermum erythrorhizon TaxID=34254 RepID=A0AAV3P7Y1_LITER
MYVTHPSRMIAKNMLFWRYLEDAEENERKNANLTCFLNGEEAEDEMGPVLPDIGSLPEVEFETSEHLVKLIGDDEKRFAQLRGGKRPLLACCMIGKYT